MSSIEEIKRDISEKNSEYEQLDFDKFSEAMITNRVISFTQLNKIQTKKYTGTDQQKMIELLYLIRTTRQSHGRLAKALQEALGVNNLNRLDLLGSIAVNPVQRNGSGGGGSANGASIAADPNSSVSQPEVVNASDALAAANLRILSLEAKYNSDLKLQKAELDNVRLNEVMILKDQLATSENKLLELDIVRLNEVLLLNKEIMSLKNQLHDKDVEIVKLKSINEGVWGLTQSPPSDQEVNNGGTSGGNAQSAKNTKPS